MNDSIFHQIQECTQYLNLELPAQEIANLSVEQEFSEECIEAVASVFSYLREKKSEQIVSTLLRMSRLPLKEPKVSHKGKPKNMPIHAKGRPINAPVPPVPLAILRQICYDNINVTTE